ncbi:MAG: glycine--tRNA ligase [Bacilli bacterium]|nr:glycine--tRNA ligase [Acholeplasmataceae bacterium]MDY2902570.1 glycine--tRNA ligase [Bacilli bacterium]
MSKNISMTELVAFLKHQGFVYQGSEIYGGLANAWDYGPLGVELKNNIKKLWWKKFVQESPTNVGLDCAILMNPNVWVASGHVGGFSDPLIDCKHCGTRHRADKLIEDFTHGEITGDGWTNEQLMDYIIKNKVPCPDCGSTNFTDIRKFNLMFKTNQGVIEDEKNAIYLRPETAQGIFVNFKNVQRTTRKKVPFGIGQIGKSFRNEITPGNFIFRTREFEQMEMEFFCKPGTDLEWFNYWKKYCLDFLGICGLEKERLRYRDHAKEELCFYSNATTDIEFNFAFGWGELWGIADRTDYDLKTHQTHSKESLEYFDPETNEKYLPYVVEPSVGVERLLLAVLTSAYDEEQLENDTRVVLRLKPYLAPYKVAVLPLVNKLQSNAMEVYNLLAKEFNCDYDAAGNIGKRYRRQDMIGTPYCVTFDFDSLNDNCVTVRDRDSMTQERVKIEDLVEYIAKRIK